MPGRGGAVCKAAGASSPAAVHCDARSHRTARRPACAALLQVLVEGHRHAGIYIARGKEDALVTRNMVPGESVYGEKRVAVEQVRGRYSSRPQHSAAQHPQRVRSPPARAPRRHLFSARGPGPRQRRAQGQARNRQQHGCCWRLQPSGPVPSMPNRASRAPLVAQEGGEKIEYRVWNPFRSKLAAAVLAGVDNIHIKPGECGVGHIVCEALVVLEYWLAAFVWLVPLAWGGEIPAREAAQAGYIGLRGWQRQEQQGGPALPRSCPARRPPTPACALAPRPMQAARCCTWARPAAPLCRTCRTLWGRRARCTRWSSRTAGGWVCGQARTWWVAAGEWVPVGCVRGWQVPTMRDVWLEDRPVGGCATCGLV